MSGNNDILKSVNDLLKMKFFIPSYQRGYRWTEQQVEDLLNDIWEYAKNREYAQNQCSKFYCLQPLVVCAKGELSLNVIDGQQRLTTIYLILKYLNEKSFSLEYERENYLEKALKEDISNKEKDFDDFWKNLIKRNKDFDKIEIYYLLQACFFIKKWFENLDKTSKDKFTTILKEHVKFIWYLIHDKNREHEFFRNLNSGKIQLTNSELIKALFLIETNSKSKEKEIRQSLIADEFDQMERTLRNDDFWYFLAGDTKKPSSCLDLVFNLMLDTSDKSNDFKDKDFGSFFYLRNKLQSKSQKDLWEDVRNYFYILDGWYKNPITYNLVGYLRSCIGQDFTLKSIYELWVDAETKEDFVSKLKKQCKESINYKNDKFMDLQYTDKKIRNLLLFLNIATLLNNPMTKVKFQFSDFHNNNWDVEHISPKQPKTEDIIKTINDYYKNENENITDENKKRKPCKKLSYLLKKGDRDTIMENYFASSDVLNTLANLTLLSEHTNRGIGNDFFFEKRKRLIEYYQQGYYIPPCSMNVFQKFYSEDPDNMLFWSIKDQEQYFEKIKTTIKQFFEGK